MNNNFLFYDRIEAGEQLAEAISDILAQTQVEFDVIVPIVYALPRGGIPVAIPIARRLGCPLDIIVAKKIGHPKNPELAIGAVTADGSVFWDDRQPFRFQNPRQREIVLTEALDKAQAQFTQLSPACPEVNPQGAIAIIVDDGIATGMTIAVAARALRTFQPAAVWLCAPVAPLGILPWLQQWGDRVIVLETPETFFSVSRFYTNFPQVETEEVLADLQQQNDWLNRYQAH